MHEMELLISHGGSESTDQFMNNAADPIIIKRVDDEMKSSLTRHNKRERIRWWWEYCKPKKRRRGLHQEDAATMIINPAKTSPADHLLKDQDDHHFNGGQNPADQICLALLFTLCHHFCQAMIGVYEMLLVEKEAENCSIMCSWGDHHGTHKEQQQHQRV